MAHSKLETLQASMPAMLPAAVRQDQRSPAFEITRWTVERLSSQGMINPDGLWLYSGEGRDQRGERPWSVVLKLLKDPGEEGDTTNIWYWKREYLAMETGLLSTLPPGTLVPPRCYGVEERDGFAWIWMERVTPSAAGRWTPEQYRFAARQCGRFNGAYMTDTPQPDFPWLSRRAAYGWAESFPPTGVWEHPNVVRFFPTGTEARVMRLWDELPRFNDAIDQLPQTFLHADTQRRNLFLRTGADGTDEIVAIDWAQCGIGAVAADLVYLIGGSALLTELEPEEVREIEPAAFDAYLSGLRDAGWQGNGDLVRLGYCAWFALLLGTGLPVLATWDSERHAERMWESFRRTLEQMNTHIAALTEIALERADEARLLMDKLL